MPRLLYSLQSCYNDPVKISILKADNHSSRELTYPPPEAMLTSSLGCIPGNLQYAKVRHGTIYIYLYLILDFFSSGRFSEKIKD